MNKAGPIWIVGDLQGCCQPLQALLAHPDIADDADSRLWFAGDLINRGPASLETLRTVIGLGERAVCVLGNHDLNLLAVAAGVKKPGKSDTIDDILQASDAEQLITWLRHRPLVHHEQDHLMVHAGILPEWDLQQTLALASEVESALRGPQWKSMLRDMYGNEPVNWADGLQGAARLRVIINAFTRMRMCDLDGNMDFSHKGAPSHEDDLLPWFDLPNRAIRGQTIVFGHWSTLGLMIRPDAVCLDTGCVWGRQLTAMRVHDHKLVQIPCDQYRKPKTR